MVQSNFRNKESQLMNRLRYHFKDPKLLRQALTHRSASPLNNERFEFLGDSILGFLISEYLFLRFPNEPEGRLTRLRASLVKGEMLAKIAVLLSLGDYLYLGPGELKSGGFRRTSILADAMEAVFAAIFLDGGIDACREVVLSLYQSELEEPLSLKKEMRDPKTELQEILQARKSTLPEYTLLASEDELFRVQCRVLGIAHETIGIGETRKKAEQDAAFSFIQWFKASAS